MKKLHFLIAFLIITSSLFYSCTEEENNDPPTISLKTGIQDSTNMVYVYMDTTLTINEMFLIGVTAQSNSEKNLKKLTIGRKFFSQAVENWDTTFSSLTFTMDKTFFAASSASTEDWTFTISDVNENSSSLNFRIETIDPPDELNTYDNIEFGPYGDTLPNFFSSVNGLVYSFAEIDTISITDTTIYNLIDWIYYESNINGIMIISPADDYASSAYTNVALWPQRNTTFFKETTTSANDFDAIDKYDEVFDLANGANLPYLSDNPNTHNNGISEGDVFAFIAASGKMGVIKIETINSNTGTLIIDIKVKK